MLPTPEPADDIAPPRATRRVVPLGLILLVTTLHLGGAEGVATGADDPDDLTGDVTTMAAFNVAGDRLEDFGFRVSPGIDAKRSFFIRRVFTPVVDVVLPNTAAARAGLRPGDRIVKADGRSTASGLFSFNKWRRIQEAKWKEVAEGKTNVTWTLEVEAPASGALRTLRLVVPTPAPHWGSTVWVRPNDRPPADVAEEGPLAGLAATVLDNGIWILLRATYVNGFSIPASPAEPYFLCYQWTLWDGPRGHRIYVSRQLGRTTIILEAFSREQRARVSAIAPNAAPVGALASPTTVFATAGARAYLTSPSGALEKAWMLGGGIAQDYPLEEVRAGFEAEVDFWLNKVGPVSPRWPLSVIPGGTRGDEFAGGPGPAPLPPPSTNRANTGRAPEFLRLPPASPDQRDLLGEAIRKLETDHDHWAYTETARAMGEKQVTVVRVDPSKPEPHRHMLIEVDGRRPTAAEVEHWRDEGRDISAPLGEFGELDALLDLSDVRVLSETPTTVVFEVPTRGSLPQEQLQALLRVNKTSGGFEDITVKLRGSLRMAGVARVTEAGMEVRFQTLDPAHPPQPVFLRGGGTIRVALLVTVSRDLEATRTHFERVAPFRFSVEE